jgi:hypothetical protein
MYNLRNFKYRNGFLVFPDASRFQRTRDSIYIVSLILYENAKVSIRLYCEDFFIS